jgi:phosphoserine phosphatase
MICRMPRREDAPPAVQDALSQFGTLVRRASKDVGRTQQQVAAKVGCGRDAVSRLSTGIWVQEDKYVSWLIAEQILRVGLELDAVAVTHAKAHYDRADAWRRGADDEGSRSLYRYGRSKVGHPKRPYPSIDRIDLDLRSDGSVTGLIERVEPEGRRGTRWLCAGRVEGDRFLLTFWPTTPASDAPPATSSGHMTILRESSKRRPWPGVVSRVERGQTGPFMLAYDYWWTNPEDPVLVSASSSVAVLDFDNTLAAGWIVGDWLRLLADEGIGQAVESLDRLTRLFEEYNRRPGYGHDRLAEDAGRVYADALKNVEEDAVRPMAGPFIADYLGPRGAGFASSRQLIAGLRDRGHRPVLITGAPAELSAAINDALDTERCFAMELGVRAGRFTGTVELNRGTSTGKTQVCSLLQEEHEADLAIAVGDSQGDVPMWERARVSIAVGDKRAHPVDIDGLDLNQPLDKEFWDRIPEASWLRLVRPAD